MFPLIVLTVVLVFLAVACKRFLTLFECYISQLEKIHVTLDKMQKRPEQLAETRVTLNKMSGEIRTRRISLDEFQRKIGDILANPAFTRYEAALRDLTSYLEGLSQTAEQLKKLADAFSVDVRNQVEREVTETALTSPSLDLPCGVSDLIDAITHYLRQNPNVGHEDLKREIRLKKVELNL